MDAWRLDPLHPGFQSHVWGRRGFDWKIAVSGARDKDDSSSAFHGPKVFLRSALQIMKPILSTPHGGNNQVR
jgi:hypothetical protein